MKIVTSEEMVRIEKLAYKEGANEEAFMEKAGRAIAESIRRFIGQHHLKPKIAFICGKGNNAGDGFVAARDLLQGDFDVFVLALAAKGECSWLTQKQWEAFEKKRGDVFSDLDFRGASLLVDGIFGTGFKGEVEGVYKTAIEKMNSSMIPILSIDVPSGIQKSGVMASQTVFLGLPKWGCFLGDAWNHTGKIEVVNFGLQEKFVEEAHSDYLLLEEKEVAPLLPQLKRNQHKYEAGYVLGLGGSTGMPGAAIMASFASLRSGAGIVRLFHPEEMAFDNVPLEIIRVGYKKGEYDFLNKELERASALFVGPGMGVSEEAKNLLQHLFAHIKKPVVIDADALTLMAAHRFSPPPSSILTPHHGEMKRLLNLSSTPPIMELLEKSGSYANANRVTLVLKGSPTFIFHPGAKTFVMPRGDPGMATAGSGDVLTGIIGALLGAKLTPLDAAKLGTYLHGIAGEIAANEKSSYSMIATDIIEALPKSFSHIQHTKR